MTGRVFMDKEPYVDATVLLYDPKLHLRKQTRSILNIIGFWQIEECENLEDAATSLRGHRSDLAIFAVQARQDGVAELVNDVRRFRCGDDPFLPIILTSWDGRLRLIRSIINSGADYFLVNPYSTKDLGERINALVSHRKPFVVSEAYFGPDRRTLQARAGDAGTVDVPNALRARAQKRPELGPNPEMIESALGMLRRVKIRNVARRMWAIADILFKAREDPSLADWIDQELQQILKSGRTFHESIEPSEAAQLGSLCDSVVRVANTVRNERPTERNLELLEQSALALRVASQLGGDSSVAASEISSAVSGVGTKTNSLAKSVFG
ncbi:MAG: hypothetical protein HN478_02020 [Rhodospirillaceae bacterium]|nr:hypothetical protein [Rhodospirillaceae bacterium]